MFSLWYIAIGLLMNNASLSMQTGMVNPDKSFVCYSRTHATHWIQDVEFYQVPSAISEVSVTSCQGKGLIYYRGFL